MRGWCVMCDHVPMCRGWHTPYSPGLGWSVLRAWYCQLWTCEHHLNSALKSCRASLSDVTRGQEAPPDVTWMLCSLWYPARAVRVCECIHSDAPTESTLRFNLKCSVYGSVVVCLSIGINMLQIFYTSSMLINAQNRNSEHATHFAERTQTIRKIYILNSH